MYQMRQGVSYWRIPCRNTTQMPSLRQQTDYEGVITMTQKKCRHLHFFTFFVLSLGDFSVSEVEFSTWILLGPCRVVGGHNHSHTCLTNTI